MTLDVDQRWIAKLEVHGITNQPTRNLVDYVYSPITCKYCLRSFYKVVDCQVAKQKKWWLIKSKTNASNPLKIQTRSW